MSSLSLAAFTTTIIIVAYMQIGATAVEMLSSFQKGLQAPFLISTQSCFAACDNRGGFCGGFCGVEGYCCRKGFGDCLESYEEVTTSSHHSCVKGLAPSADISEEVRNNGSEKCRVDIITGEDKLHENMVLGELDKLPEEYTFTFDIQPTVNTPDHTEYKLVLFSKNKQWLGGKFSIFGENGRYYADFCGSMSGDYGGCTGYTTTHEAGEWIHVHVHQAVNEFGMSVLEVFINGVLQETVTNIIPQAVIEDLKIVMVVLPFPSDKKAGTLKDVHFAACDSKFNATTHAY